jgi:hypothetical protein
MVTVRIAFTFTLCALCALVAACDSPRTQLDPHDLSIAAQQVESIAAESRWLAQELRVGDIPSGMAWVHQKALGDDALKAAQQVTKPAPASLRDSQQQVAQLAARLQSQVSRIAPAANHPGDLDALAREFESIANAAHPLADRS